MRAELAGQLRQLRDLTGRSLRELASDVHGSSSSLSRYFSGQAVPPWPTVVALCKVAGRDPRPMREVWERAKDEPQTRTAATTATAPVRNDLPHDITAFTGRRKELAALLGAARNTTMVAIDGMGGVGKTALAVHGAHLLTAEFPGGKLYLDLHGFTPGREPVEPTEALRVLLAALGVPPGRIPVGIAERAALWRSELAARRAIVLLDNAADADHVRDLLPGAGRSFGVVTSRRRMVELDGVQPISLDVLPALEAAELFLESAGGARSGDVGEVLRRCGNLPLAIRVAAARLRHRPAWTLDTLVERLREGEPAVSDVLEMSLRQLDSAQRRMFRLLGLASGTDMCVHGAAALADIPLGNARGLLEELVDAHLIQEPTAGRYRLHDLLRQAARADGTEPDAVAAIARLADYYLSGVLAADQGMRHKMSPLPITIAHPPERVPEMDGMTGALAWLDREWANIEAVFALAVELRLDTSVIGLTLAADVYFMRRGGLGRWEPMIDIALSAAQRRDDRRSLIWLRFRRGLARHLGGRSTEALPEFEAVQALMAEAGDVHIEFEVLQRLAEQRMRADDFEGCLDLLRQGEVILPEGSDFDVYRVLTQGRMGKALVRLERFEQAREAVLSVIQTARTRNDPQLERLCLDVLAAAALGLGDAPTALELSQQAVEISRATGHQFFEAVSLTDAAVAARHLGQIEEALALHEEAHRIIEATGEQQYAIGVLLAYGETCRLVGDPVTAERHLGRALELATALEMLALADEARRNFRLLRECELGS
ncbi:tetratricopeptide repeat protein [Streptomyces sp. NPDC005181]|uniref:ATP-binding protein n=1 Tax=Streptomyces sp. NPDC005181 TaxID=3156869 RepID=UPI0033A57B42